jgi:hypothetical protein
MFKQSFQQNIGPRTALLPSRPPPPRPAAVRVRPAVPPPPSAERRMRSAPSKPKTLVESTPEPVAAATAAPSTSTSDPTAATCEAAAKTLEDTTSPSALNSEDNGINQETLPIAAAAIIASATAEAAQGISPMETADEAETPVKTINEDDETITTLAAAPMRLPSPIDFPQEYIAETTEIFSSYPSHTADLETICLLLEVSRIICFSFVQ